MTWWRPLIKDARETLLSTTGARRYIALGLATLMFATALIAFVAAIAAIVWVSGTLARLLLGG